MAWLMLISWNNLDFDLLYIFSFFPSPLNVCFWLYKTETWCTKLIYIFFGFTFNICIKTDCYGWFYWVNTLTMHAASQLSLVQTLSIAEIFLKMCFLMALFPSKLIISDLQLLQGAKINNVLLGQQHALWKNEGRNTCFIPFLPPDNQSSFSAT